MTPQGTPSGTADPAPGGATSARDTPGRSRAVSPDTGDSNTEAVQAVGRGRPGEASPGRFFAHPAGGGAPFGRLSPRYFTVNLRQSCRRGSDSVPVPSHPDHPTRRKPHGMRPHRPAPSGSPWISLGNPGEMSATIPQTAPAVSKTRAFNPASSPTRWRTEMPELTLPANRAARWF